MGRGGGIAGRRGAVRAIALGVLLCAAQGAAAGKSAKGKGTMADPQVTFYETDLGTRVGLTGTEHVVNTVPLVLWSGATPAAVLSYRTTVHPHLGRGDDAFERIDGGHSGPFPVKASFRLDAANPGDRFNLGEIEVADLDGDGVEELVLLRERGALEVLGVRRVLGRYDLPASREASFVPVSTHRARLADREVLYQVFGGRSSKPEVKVEDAVLRIDAHGVTRLRLGDAVAAAQVLCVGTVVAAGAREVSELLVLSARDDQVRLSRHRPDGAPLDAPRKLYRELPPIPPVRFASLPGARQQVVLHEGARAVYFLDPEKPANWLHAVDLAPLPGSAQLHLLGAVDPGAPKALLEVSGKVYAVDAEGTFFEWAGGWRPAKGRTPFLDVAPAEKDGWRLVDVDPDPAQPERLLVVISREADRRTPSFDEAMEAARRLLPPHVVTRELDELEPRLPEKGSYAELLVERELAARNIARAPTTVEEWRRLLPDSFTGAEAERRQRFVGRIVLHVETSSEPEWEPSAERRQAAAAWLAGLDVPAETRLAWYQGGTRLAEIRLDGSVKRTDAAQLDLPLVSSRTRDAATAAVLPLTLPGSPRPRTRFAVVRFEQGR